MRLIEQTIDSFLAFEHVEVPWAEAEQVGVVGPNGAGKSSLLDALRFAVWGAGRASPDEMIRNDASSCAVSVTFRLREHEYRIRRERDRSKARGESTLSLEIDGEQATGHTMLETQVRIERELGLSERGMLAGPIMVQNSTDELMRLKPADRKDLLIEVFDLQKYAAYEARAKEWSFAAHAALDALEARLTALETLIATEVGVRRDAHQAKEALDTAAATVEALSEEVVQLRERAAALQERARRQEDLATAQAAVQARLERDSAAALSLHDRLTAYRNALTNRPLLPPTTVVAAVQEQVAEYEGKVASLDGAKERRGELETQWRLASRQAKVVDVVPCHGEGKYAACPLLADAMAAKAELPGIQAAGKSTAQSLEQLTGWTQHLATLRTDLAGATEAQHRFEVDQRDRTGWELAIAEGEPTLASLRTSVEEASTEITRLNADRLRIQQDVQERRALRDELGSKAVALELAKNEVEAKRIVLTDASARLREIARAKEQRDEATGQQGEISARSAALRLLCQAFHRDGIPTLILENGIPLIEQRANEVLARLPGAWSVEIRTQSEKKSGGLREQLDVVLTAGGDVRGYELLSGGERFRVDFALRMALASVLARRAGATIDTLWLDEGWGSQDREGREALLEAIAAVSDEFSLIVVVSHVPEVTDRMPQRLLVEKSNGASTVELVA